MLGSTDILLGARVQDTSLPLHVGLAASVSVEILGPLSRLKAAHNGQPMEEQ